MLCAPERFAFFSLLFRRFYFDIIIIRSYLPMKYLAILTTLLLVAFLSDCRIAPPVSTITPSPRPTQTIASDALTYLNNALDLIQEYSYYRKKVDWPAIRNEAYYIASGATTPAQTYGAINLVFPLIGDTHGRLTQPFIPVGVPTPYPSFEPTLGKLIEGHLGYILVPETGYLDSTTADQYIASMQGAIKKIDQSHPCGWIVDLRGNPGGWYSPMEVGIGPILGDGNIGGTIDADGKITPLTYSDGVGKFGNEIEYVVHSPYVLIEHNPPVAVLTDGGTSSAAELLTVVFRGRPDTLSFGQPTGGHNPGEGKVLTLSDGGTLWITTELSVDRTGKIYPEAPIQPDEVVPLIDGSIPQVALDWLHNQPACSIQHEVTPSP